MVSNTKTFKILVPPGSKDNRYEVPVQDSTGDHVTGFVDIDPKRHPGAIDLGVIA